MARQKTNKTAKKRFKATNPKGNKKPKIKFSRSTRNHLKVKKSSRQKSKIERKGFVSDANYKNIVKKVVNF